MDREEMGNFVWKNQTIPGKQGPELGFEISKASVVGQKHIIGESYNM